MYYEAIGRLRPAVSAAQARAETEVIFQQYKHDKPSNFDATSDVVMTVGDLQANLVANVRPTLLILSAAVGFVLADRLRQCREPSAFPRPGAKEGIRRSQRAGSAARALIRQLLTESVLMAVVSGGLGILLGQYGDAVPCAHLRKPTCLS